MESSLTRAARFVQWKGRDQLTGFGLADLRRYIAQNRSRVRLNYHDSA
jgi:hypothetical protein